MFRRLAAAAAVASAAAAIWLIVPSRRPPAAVSAGAFRAYLAVSPSAFGPAPGLFGAPRDLRDRWLPRAAEIGGEYAPLETSFAIALDSGQTGCLRDWSLALVRETDGPAFSLRTDRLPGKGSIKSVRGQS